MPKVERRCQNCGNVFYVRGSVLKNGRGKFCSKTCSNLHCLFDSKRAKVHGFKNGNTLGVANFKGGWKDSSGYISTHRGKPIRMHRYVMEQHLGRTLTQEEHVHHKNGDKQDNRLENLELLTKTEHSREHYRARKIDSRGRFLPKDRKDR